MDHDLIESVLYLPENLLLQHHRPGIVRFLNKAKPKARMPENLAAVCVRNCSVKDHESVA